ncbi:hypothetical protein KG089_05320 [Carnobacteriaceae bacterium zg-ZUI252]|nr:hypothetical protein [Carnobacteriaceae bacterium zg-ZUI252]
MEFWQIYFLFAMVVLWVIAYIAIKIDEKKEKEQQEKVSAIIGRMNRKKSFETWCKGVTEEQW